MELDPCIRKPWSISKDMARLYSKEKVEKTLGFFNRAGNGNFYMVDYRNQKIIMGDSTNLTLTGYSKKTIVREKFGFFNRILKQEEKEWLQNANNKAFDVFFGYPESQRLDLEFTYDLIAQTLAHHEIILRHKMVPYKLCNNGNLWLGLCFIMSISFLPIRHKACIVNAKTGDTHIYNNNTFVLSKFGTLNPEERRILDLMSKDVPTKKIYEILKISESSFKQKKQGVFNKLNAQSWAAAVQQAHLLGLF